MADACGCGCGHRDDGATAGRGRAADALVADLARDPAALAVLERFGVNHCCGGHLSLREGAAAAGVELPALLRALEEAGRHAP
jgi:iron-sulfur cluster repair protein YtfE (RIC family)